MRCDILLPPFTLFAFVAAHSMHRWRAPTSEELAREEIRAHEHAIMAGNCESQIREHMAVRMRRSEMLKHEAEAVGGSIHVARATTPYYHNIQNMTCLTAPEVAEGTGYVNNELVRQDIGESQQGVKLLMDLGVMDTTTCTPINYTLVEIWQANAVGDYSAYHDPNPFNGTETWLRGGWYTDANGIVEMTTIYPGYYTGRAPHIHLMVHKDWIRSDNDTLVSHSGTVLHIGQAFFPENWNDQVYKTSPYTSNTKQRTLNTQDTTVTQAFRNGYSAYANLQYINGNDLSGGLVGYLTVGVDTRSAQTITNKNYSDTNGVSPGGPGSGVGGDGGNSSGNPNPSSATTQAQGWGNTFYLSLLMLAFFAYRCTPDPIHG